MSKAVTELAGLGAKKFMIVNSIDYSFLPDIEDNYQQSAIAYSNQLNTTLPVEMEKLAKQLNVKIDIFDYAAANDNIRKNPDQYALTNLTDPCFVQTESGTTTCEKPDEYYFWDYMHPTRRVHQIMGEAMAKQSK